MKYIGIRLICFIFLLGCVETDIEDPLDPLLLIKLINEENVLHVTEKHKLEAVYTDDSGDTIMDVSIAWASSDPSILMIVEDSAIAIKPGMVMVSASVQGAQDSVALEILESRESIQISIFREMLVMDATTIFKVNYTLPNGDTESSITPDWSSSDESIASIDDEGLVSALKVGSTVISASYGNVSDQVTLEVTAKPVVVDPEVSITTFVELMQEGNEFQFEAQYHGTDGMPDPNAVISWSSSDVQVLSIDQDGLALAVAVGQATVTASHGDVSDQITLEVTAKPVMVDPEVRLTAFTEFIQEGNEFQFEAQYYGTDGMPDPTAAISWSSSDVQILSIDQNGLASALAVGRVTITASHGGVSDQIALEVTAKPVMVDPEVSITTFTKLMQEEEQFQFEAQYRGSDGMPDPTAAISWSSSDVQVLSIDQDGLASALAVGQVTITASHGGVSDQVTLEVTAKPVMVDPEVRLTTFAEFIEEEEQFQFEAQYYGTDGMPDPTAAISWSSSDVQILSIDQNGLASALAVGQVTITASHGGVSDQVTVTVTAKPVMVDPEVRITTFTGFMREGAQFQFEAQYYGTDGMPDPTATISWSSSDVQILSIDQNGLALALAVGQVTITASFGDVSATVDVEVESAPSSVRTGTLRGTGYSVSGSFRLENNNGTLTLIVEDDYISDGPDPYFYLSNQNNSVNNGVELKYAKMNGRHEIVVPERDPPVQLYTYRYLVVWCKAVGVTLGYGEFSD